MCLGVPGRVIETFDRDGVRIATVDFGDVRREACLAYAPEVEAGMHVVVHLGFAIGVVDADEAERSHALLGEIGVIR
jgi:hydrogenase expression/formation protein HypC